VSATILCVDDDRGFCQILSRAFSQAGYRVETVHDGETALQQVKRLRPALVTLDVMLPRLDGFSVLQAIRGQTEPVASTPTLFVSGCTFTPAYGERAKRLGALGVVKKPVPLDRLLALVEEILRKRGGAARAPAPEAAPAVAQKKPARTAAPSEIAFDGEIADLPFADLLHHLHGMRVNGVLEIVHGKKKKSIQFRDGVPEAIRSNLVQETLGHLLVASGRISADVLHQSLLQKKNQGGLLGQILLASQMLDEEDLARALRTQADEKLFELFSWRAGRFHLHRNARLRSGNALHLKHSPADLVLRGVVERMPFPVVAKRLADNAGRLVVPGGTRFYQFQDVSLGEEGEALLARVDGKKTLARLAANSEREQRLLYGLLALEMLDLDDVGSDTAAHAPAAAQASGWRLREVQRKVQGSEARATASEVDAQRSELSALAERIRGRDPWQTLGVAPDASDERIRNNYAELAKRVHPDRFIGASDAVRRLAEEVFGLASTAFDAIRDDDARTAYARSRKQAEADRAAREESERAVYAEREFVKGESLLRAKRPLEALPHLRNAVEAYPEEGEYHVYYGWALYVADPEKPGVLEKALGVVMKGRKLAPDRPTPYLFLGRLCQAGNRVDTAEKMFARAIQLDPDCLEAVRELRLVRMRQDKARGIVGRILRRS
jgi:CheY-like chemotaxis protein/tetratricopeptide (TPR) repeat protein